MTDVIFYNNVSRSVIGGYKMYRIPRVNEHVNLMGQEYIVNGILHDYDKECVHIFVTKVTPHDVRFM